MKKRYPEIDVLYVIGIVLVLIGHSHSSYGGYENTVLVDIISFIYFFHMPLFFSLSGFLFKASDSLERDGFIRWIQAKFLRLLVPYVFWSLIAIVPKYYFENGTCSGLNVAYLIQSFLVPRKSIWGHFWFLPVLFNMYVFFGLLESVVRNKKVLYSILGIASFILYFLPIQTGVLGIADLSKYSIYFFLGLIVNHVFFSESEECCSSPTNLNDSFHKAITCFQVRNSTVWGGAILWCLAIICLSSLYVKYCRQSSILTLLSSILMISVCVVISCNVKPTKAIEWISAHNLTLYIFSWFFQSVVMIICTKFQFEWILTFIFMFISGFVGPLCVIRIYEVVQFLHQNWVRLVLGIR